MTRNFVNRASELKKLTEFSKNQKAALIYGRRRIGKTRLIKEFIKGKKAIYLSAINRGVEYNLDKFSNDISETYNVPGLRFKNFLEMFDFLNKTDTDIIALDEFGYLIDALPEFQEIVDSRLDKRLILTGSTVSLIESKLLNYKNPLYGRIDLYLKIGSLKLKHLKEWFPKANIEQLVEIYGVSGGVPKYLEFFEGSNAKLDIKGTFFDDSSFLFRDAKLLLEEELREPYRYYLILEAIAGGRRTINEISGHTKIASKDLPFYLKVLRNLYIIRAENHLFIRKSGRYVFNDNYFNFWFRFISHFEDEIESGFNKNALAEFEKGFGVYMGHVFEEVCKEFLAEDNVKLPFSFSKIGRWWHKDNEIDLIALNEETKELGFFECKWKALSEKEAIKILEELKEKSKLVDWNNGKRKEYFGIIAKSIKEKEKLRKAGVLAFDLEDFE